MGLAERLSNEFKGSMPGERAGPWWRSGECTLGRGLGSFPFGATGMQWHAPRLAQRSGLGGQGASRCGRPTRISGKEVCLLPAPCCTIPSRPSRPCSGPPWRIVRAGVDAWLREVVRGCRETEFVETLMRRRRYLPHINAPGPRAAHARARAERQAVNTVCQVRQEAAWKEHVHAA